MNWDEQEYFTTKEASNLLGISLSTVQRYFDGGYMWGSKHPITNRRMIHRDSIKQIAEKFRVEIPIKRTPKKEEINGKPS
jgi:predicted site-specific integrase-resolvase